MLLCAFTTNPGDGEQTFPKIMDDDSDKYTNVGNIGITVTNFGTYGHGFVLWPDQPSCEFPLGSGIEHIFDGGIWVGGFRTDNDQGANRVGPFVSTGAIDVSSVSRQSGFEYTNAAGSKVKERSSLFDSRVYSPSAISHQDFLVNYTDTNTIFLNGEPILDHVPFGFTIRQETYAWDYPFANFFVIFNYWIKNVSGKYLDSVFVGLWTDTVVRNTLITGQPSGSAFYNKGGNGYNDSIKIAYEFDSNGDVGFTDSYVGILYLGSDPKLADKFFYPSVEDSLPTTAFNSWQFRNTSDPNFFSPQDDIERYQKMQGFFGGSNYWKNGINPESLNPPSNRSMLISNGPFRYIANGDSINVVFAIVCAKKYGTDPASLDTKEQKTNLYSNADWALRAYHGEDRNRNGILDPGEDLDGDGKITRYILPAPPITPKVKVIPENQKVTIYWDRRAEFSIDPISAKRDFEGYRIYRTQAGFDLTQKQDILASMVQLASFDSAGNNIEYDTGFEFVRLSTPVVFPGDTNQYYYKFELDNLLNGWQYLFAVTAFDEGDPENDLNILESSPLANFERVLPGTPPEEDSDVQIGVYPNPYYGNAIWDGSSERLRKIYFFNLPGDCEITIYTLAGDVVKRIQHTSQSNNSEIRWFETYASDDKQKLAGGEHAWDLLTDNEQAIATGLYLFTVKNNNNGEIKTGKFLVIK